MNKYTLYFQNKSLENEYFHKSALPHYYKIFSVWCICLIVISIPAALFTFFTGNLQYFGFTFAASTSTLSLIALKFKKSAFNVVAALYNASFVVLNFIFLTITDRKIGVEGDYETIMYVFAGSQYTFHSILSMGTNFLLTSSVIIIQNLTYSIVFYPGNLNLIHGLLLFATCFLIWTKYHTEKQKRKNFLLQENEKEWSSFVRDVLPSSVIMVKFDKANDQIKTKLTNRAAKNNFHIKDEESMKQFIRNTHIWSEPKEKQGSNHQNTRPSLNKSFQKNSATNVETLEKYIYYRFKMMDKTQRKVIDINNNTQCNIKPKFDIFVNDSYQNSKNQPDSILKQSVQLDQSQFSPTIASKPQQQNNFQEEKKPKFNKYKAQESRKEIDFDFDMHSTETYNVEQFKAKIIKNNKLVEVSIKIVFYNLSYPVCSISIDENLKQQVQNISKLSLQKEKIYFEHFKKIINKFTRVINTKDVKLIHPIGLMHLNHLRNLRDLINLKQENILKISYQKFELTSLLTYLQNIYQNYFQSIGVKFKISIKHEKQIETTNQDDKMKQTQIAEKDIESVNLDKNIKQLIQRNKEAEDLFNIQLQIKTDKQLSHDHDNDDSEIYLEKPQQESISLESFNEIVNIFNDQQRICQVVINLIENANDYLSQTDIKEKEICLFVKIISGSDDASNLIEFKVTNTIDDNFPREKVNTLKEWLKEERQSSNFNLIWKSVTYFQPTQLGLRLNEKILEKVSPFNYLNLEIPDQCFEASFFVYQDCTILQNAPKKTFQNKIFDNIRQSQIVGFEINNTLQIPILKENLSKSNMLMQSNLSFTLDKNNVQTEEYKNFLQIPLKEKLSKSYRLASNLSDISELNKNKHMEIDFSEKCSFQNLSYLDVNAERTPNQSNQSVLIKHFNPKNISELNLLNANSIK